MQAIRKIIYIALALMIMFLSTDLTGQEQLKVPKASVTMDFIPFPKEIKNEQQQKIKDILRDLINKYAFSSDFANDRGGFSKEKHLMFSGLFTNDAKLTNYLLKKPVEIETYNYTTFIWDHFEKTNKSIDQKFIGATVESVEINPSGNYLCKVVIEIDNHMRYDEKTSKTLILPKSERIVLFGILIIEPSEEKSGKFIQLRVKEREVQAASFQLNPGLTYGLGRLSGGSANGFENVKPSTAASGIHLDLSRGIGKNEKLHLWLGVGWQYANITTDFSGKYSGDISTLADPNGTISKHYFQSNGIVEGPEAAIIRVDSIVSGIEKIKGVSLISGVVGIGYNLAISAKNTLSINLGIMPVYMTGVAIGSREVSYSGFNLPDKKNFPDVDELQSENVLNDFTVTDQQLDIVDKITANSNFSLSAIIAPSIRIPVGFKWGIQAGASYSIGLNDLFSHNSLNRDLKNSIVQDYLPTSKHGQFQVRAGVYLQL